MTIVRAAVFRDDGVIELVPLAAGVPVRGDAPFTWIEVLNPVEQDFERLQERFGLHPLAIKDSMSPHQAPKVDVYDGQTFVVLKLPRLRRDRIVYTRIDAFVSGRHLISVRHEDCAEGPRMQERFPRATLSARSRPAYILHAILDSVVGHYFPVAQMIEEEVLSMEQRLVDSFLDREQVTRLFRMRREAIHLQHTLTLTSDVCGKLTNLDLPCIAPELKPYFRDVHDQLMRLDGMVRGLVDVIGAEFEVSTLLEQQRLGASTRKLAGWAAILGVPTVVAAVHGVDFHPIAMSVMAVSCLGVYAWFRTLRWL